MDSFGATRRFFGLDFDLFSLDDEPSISRGSASSNLASIQENPENPTLFENSWNKSMMLIGLLSIAGIVAAGILFWKMFKTNEEIPNEEEIPIDEPLIESDDEEQSDPTLVLRNRKVKRK